MRDYLLSNSAFDYKSYPNAHLPIRRYNKLSNLFLKFFRKVITLKENNKKIYLNKSDCLHALFRNAAGKRGTPRLNWMIEKQANRYLFNNPRQRYLTVEELSHRLYDLRHELWNDGHAPDREALVAGLRKKASIPTVLLNETDELLKTLKEGDILVYNTFKSYSGFDRVIRSTQRFLRRFIRGVDKESFNATHLAIYTNGKVAEASDSRNKKCVRVVDLKDYRATLTAGHKECYRVFRAKGKNASATAQEAARLARQYAEDLETKLPENKSNSHEPVPFTKILYNMKHAAYSLIKNSKFEIKGRQRFLSALIMNHLQFDVPITHKGKVRDFFCSYFIGWLYQAGQTHEILNLLKEKGMDVLEREQLPYIPTVYTPSSRLEGMNNKQYARLLKRHFVQHRKTNQRASRETMRIISKWVRENEVKFREEIKKHAFLQLDVKRVTPQKFITYMMNESQKFEEVCNILPPVA